MTDATGTVPQPVTTSPGPRAGRQGVLRSVVRSAEGVTGLLVAAVVLLVIVAGPHLAPYPPDEIGVGDPVTGPSSEHLLGTDGLGRDVLSRFLHGGSDILFIPLVAVALAALVGGTLGLVAGFSRGRVDQLISAAFDLALSFPPLLLVMVVIARAGRSSLVVAVVVAFTFAPRIGRVVRGAAQVAASEDYTAAAVARGERRSAILVREILPNIVGPTIADVALRMTYAIIFVATLSFLGLGAQPPSSNWGLMVSEARDLMTTSPQIMLAPAVGIVLLSVAFNLIGDALTRHYVSIGAHHGAEGGMGSA